jgi:hypothetical protein
LDQFEAILNQPLAVIVIVVVVLIVALAIFMGRRSRL